MTILDGRLSAKGTHESNTNTEISATISGNVSDTKIYQAGRDINVYGDHPSQSVSKPLPHTESIPRTLIEQVSEGRAVLFLGQGAITDSVHKNGKKFPTLDELKRGIVQKFLDDSYSTYPLTQIIELASSERTITEVQAYIASIYEDLYPADYHKLIPGFVWHTIVTTNIDLVIERAYGASENKLQRPVVFKKNGERVEEKLRESGTVVLLKLAGCITDISDEKTPLLLNPEQRSYDQDSRSRLFERTESLAFEFPFIILGGSLADEDVRSILKLISQKANVRPRSYIVAPNMAPAQVRYWEDQRFTCIGMTCKDFLEQLDDSIPKDFRVIANLTNPLEHPIFKRFTSSELPSSRLIGFLTKYIDYIHRDYKTTPIDPKAFYQGYFDDLTPIALNLDVRRSKVDPILSEVFFVSESDRLDRAEFYLIKGHAGSGKSVMVRRLAWDASIDFNQLCLLIKHPHRIDYEALSELYRLTKKRIFLFVDPVREYIDSIEFLIREARRNKLPLTIIGAEREGVWNTSCSVLEPFLTNSYEIKYLSEEEIIELISLLSRYKSLGSLEGLTFEQQTKALSGRAERQLLVALHEATLGKPFRQIVVDEFNAIVPQKARSLYLTVCIFHRLGVQVRAGLISRVHRIPFTMFEQELFKPLESIVFASYDNSIMDNVYRSRHSQIAEIVFEEVLANDDARFSEYVSLLTSIDVDYNSDYEALKGLTNAKQLLGLFHNKDYIKQIYKVAQMRVGDHHMLLQQEAIFEMTREDGDLDRATEVLHKATRLAPYSQVIIHSLAVLAHKKAQVARTDIERAKYREEAKVAARRLIQERTVTPHPYNTLIEIGIEELQEIMDLQNDRQIELKVKEIEQQIIRASQVFPDDSYILEKESQFNDLLGKHNHAILALERALAKNKKNVYVALRLSKMYQRDGKIAQAISILRSCVDQNPDDKDVNFNLARTLMKEIDPPTSEILFHLRRGFTYGDTNHLAQFLYARLSYLNGDFTEANKIFSGLADANLDNRTKYKPRDVVTKNGIPVKYSGTLSRPESSYAFIKTDKYQDEIYTNIDYNDKVEWKKLGYHDRVIFELAFNYKGPVAQCVSREIY